MIFFVNSCKKGSISRALYAKPHNISRYKSAAALLISHGIELLRVALQTRVNILQKVPATTEVLGLVNRAQ